MMHKPQISSSFVVAIVLGLGACNAPSGDSLTVEEHRYRPDAAVPHADAGHTLPGDAKPSDGGGTTGSDAGTTTGGDAGTTGIVSCYLGGYPNTTCALPTHCCFSNYDAQHNGECTTDSCGWGTIDCDGPEDCASGQHCCAHAMIDPENGMTGYHLACQATACGAAPVDQELCHPTSSATGTGTCSGGRTCVPALGNDNDLPRTLSICK